MWMIFNTIFEYSVFDVVIIGYGGNIFIIIFVNRYEISTLERDMTMLTTNVTKLSNTGNEQ